MNDLQKGLTANGLFSFLSGIVLVVLHESVAQLFSIENSTAFQIIGGGLLLFSFAVLVVVKLQKPALVLAIVFLDVLWVFGSVVLIFFDPLSISGAGNLVIGAVAVIVFFLAGVQYRSLSRVK